MIFLSNSAIQYAVNICQEKERYKVVVAATKESRGRAVEQLLLRTKNVDNARIINSSNNFKIMFDNGSSICLIPASDSSRGHKVHLLVVDELASEDDIHTVLKPMEILSWAEYREKRKVDME